MVYEVLKTVGTLIAENDSLSMSQNISLILQNAGLRAQAKHPEEEILNELKNQMAAINEQLNNDIVKSIVELVEGKIIEMQRPNKYKNYDIMLNEYNMNDVVVRLKESSGYADPILKGFVDNMTTQLSYAKVPHFKYIPVVLDGLKNFENISEVKSETEKMRKYVADNHKNLLILETIYELDRTPGITYSPHIEMLKEALFTKNVSAARLTSGYNSLLKTPIIENLIKGIANVESTEMDTGMDSFTGSNNPYVKVNSYVGPVLKEGKSITIFFDNNYFKIAESNKDINVDDYTSIIENKEDLFIGVMNENNVNESYVSLVKSFNKLPAKFTNEGIIFDFKRFTTEFKLNEDNKLDIYLNNTKIDEGLDDKLVSKLSLLHPSIKNSFRAVLENMENIFSIDFVKFVINERVNAETPGNGICTIRANETFVVYEYTNQLQRKLYKMDDYQYTNYLMENYRVDASNIFNVKLTERVEAIKSLSTKQTKLTNDISVLESNVDKINKTLNTDIQEKHHETLVTLKDEIEALIIKTNEELLVCKDELLKALQPENLNEGDINAGDSVKLTDGTLGRVVSTAPGLGKYVIVTENGESKTITNEEIDFNTSDVKSEEETDETEEEEDPEINREEIVAESKSWDEVKDKQHDASGCDKPEECTWTMTKGTYYPDKKDEDKKDDDEEEVNENEEAATEVPDENQPTQDNEAQAPEQVEGESTNNDDANVDNDDEELDDEEGVTKIEEARVGASTNITKKHGNKVKEVSKEGELLLVTVTLTGENAKKFTSVAKNLQKAKRELDAAKAKADEADAKVRSMLSGMFSVADQFATRITKTESITAKLNKMTSAERVDYKKVVDKLSIQSAKLAKMVTEFKGECTTGAGKFKKEVLRLDVSESKVSDALKQLKEKIKEYVTSIKTKVTEFFGTYDTELSAISADISKL